MEESVKHLKGQRTSLKAKVTSMSNLLQSSVQQQEVDDIENTRTQLKSTYSNFLTTHYEYSELVQSDESLSSYITVNGMDLTAYYSATKSSYDCAMQCYSQWQLSLSKHQKAISQAIRKAKSLLNSCTNIDIITGHRDFCASLSDDLTDIVGLKILLLDLYEVIVDLETCKDSLPANYVGHQPHQNLEPNSDPPINKTGAPGGADRGSSAEGSEHGRVSGGVQSLAMPILSHNIDNPIHLSTPVANGARLEVSNDDSRNPTGRLAVHDLHMSSQHRYREFAQPSKSSVVNAYDGYDASSFPTTLKTGNSVQNMTTGNSSQMLCTRSKPSPFKGDYHKWPEFRSVWFRYSSIFADEVDKASELKKFLLGEPLELVSPIFATQPNAHERMLQRLQEVYGDVSQGIKLVFSHLNSLKSAREGDSKALVKLVTAVENAYSQLGELGHLTSVTLPQVDGLADLLPLSVRRDWDRCYDMLQQEDKVQPFKIFMGFLDGERRRALRRTEPSGPDQPRNSNTKHNVKTFHAESDSNVNVKLPSKSELSSKFCVIHTSKHHYLHECRNFIALSVTDRYDLCKTNAICVLCLTKHEPRSCPRFKQSCSVCSKPNHHELLCRIKSVDNQNKSSKSVVSINKEHKTDAGSSEHSREISSHHGSSNPSNDATVFAIQQAPVAGTDHTAIIFFDGGSNSTLISQRAALAWGAKPIRRVDLEMSTLGSSTIKEESWLYEVKLMTEDKRAITIHALSLKKLTGSINKPLDPSIIRELFPKVDTQLLIKKSGPIDMLIGNDLLGYHPRKEIAKAGDHLRVCSGPFGLCVQGSHPALRNGESILSTLFINILTPRQDNTCTTHPRHEEFNTTIHTYLTKTEKASLGAFIQGEDLGIEVQPSCGACQCGKCPILGHNYSFREEQELQLIRNNLKYDEENKRWTTSYPWIVNPSTLPDNYSAAYATLINTERTLRKDPEWSEIYGTQIQDMVERGVARKLSKDEMKKWTGPKYYISHLAVQNPKSTSTPVRIVFNSSQSFRGTSLNACLAKGPDSYLNDLLGILLRWREERVALVADIKKMYNSIFISDIEQHTHRFLWRSMEQREPDVYIIQRVNMGDRPAAAISSEAIYKTADLFQQDYPRVSELLKNSTYVDDIVESFPSYHSAIETAEGTNTVLQKAGFKVKCWLLSGDTEKRSDLSDKNELSDETFSTQVLGVHWKPCPDVITFSTNLNFSAKKKGVYTKPNLTEPQLLQEIPEILTRRIVLEQTMKVYDPLGILCPFTMKAKQLLRETWTLKLDWDDQLPGIMREHWSKFFRQMFYFSNHEYPRCLKPEEAVGSPVLVIFSDGSATAYGFSAYVRWQLATGEFTCSLIMAKCRIAPLKQLTIPQMELNAAILSKRGRKVLEKEMRYDFSKIYQLVDSETVLKMMNKTSTRFKLYEGVRIGELQTATGGDMSCWYWVKGEKNTADWLTRGKSPELIGPSSEWWRGPDFLYLPEDQWELRTPKESEELLPGEKKAVYTAAVSIRDPLVKYENFSSLQRLIRTVARVLISLKSKSFRAISAPISPDHLRLARLAIISDVQQPMEEELTNKKGNLQNCTL